MTAARPDLSLENDLGGPVCGIDEAGRAPLAGPVTAACVYIPAEAAGALLSAGINDSKKLSAARREALYTLICENTHWGVAHAAPEEIDRINIHHASHLAMRRAFEEMHGQLFGAPAPVHALVDGRFLPGLPLAARAVIKGDGISLSIAAASILAKVTRDRLMTGLHEAYPHYGWSSNAGYPTKAHLAGIAAHGITAHHRQSFAPVRDYISKLQAV